MLSAAAVTEVNEIPNIEPVHVAGCGTSFTLSEFENPTPTICNNPPQERHQINKKKDKAGSTTGKKGTR